MRVIIAGMGSVGRHLLSKLTERGGQEIVVVDTDEQLCEELADHFDALVLHGDATDPDILEKAQIREADALVASTNSDPINTVIAMLGHRFQVDRIVVKITTNALRGALEEIGVTEIVAPSVAAAATIDDVLHEAGKRDMSLLEQCGLTVAQVQVGSAAAGHRVDDLGTPHGVLVAGIVRGESASVVGPATEVEEGDILYVIAESQEGADEARRSLAGE